MPVLSGHPTADYLVRSSLRQCANYLDRLAPQIIQFIPVWIDPNQGPTVLFALQGTEKYVGLCRPTYTETSFPRDDRGGLECVVDYVEDKVEVVAEIAIKLLGPVVEQVWNVLAGCFSNATDAAKAVWDLVNCFPAHVGISSKTG